MKIREAAVAGQFYPSDPQEIEKMLAHYNEILETHLQNETLLQLKPRAVIVPHAGYLYSAFTANIAMRLLGNGMPKRVVVIGPSHRIYLKGTSIADYTYYSTPSGTLPIDQETVAILKERFSLHCIQEAHREHSTEVEMPFVKIYAKHASVVELVYGEEHPEKLAEIIAYLLEDPDTAVVISTDLSHYHDLKKAERLDSICMDAVQALDPHMLHQGCEACGKIGMEAMILSARKRGLKPVLLDYRTSADTTGDTTQVVGYMSAAFLE